MACTVQASHGDAGGGASGDVGPQGGAGGTGADTTTPAAAGGQSGTLITPTKVYPPQSVTTTTLGTGDDSHALTQIMLPNGLMPQGLVMAPDGNLWFGVAYGTAVVRMTQAGDSTFYVLNKDCTDVAKCSLGGIAVAKDGSIWFTEYGMNKIGRLNPSAEYLEFDIPTPDSESIYIAAGPDGSAWFSEEQAFKIGRVTPAGAVSEYPIRTAGNTPGGLAVGADKNIWVVADSKIIRVTPKGEMTEYDYPAGGSGAVQIAAGPDGNLWYTAVDSVGYITPNGTVKRFPITPKGRAFAIAAGRDGNLWLTNNWDNVIGRMTPSGVFTEFSPPPLTDTPMLFTYHITQGLDGTVWFSVVDTSAYTAAIDHLVP